MLFFFLGKAHLNDLLQIVESIFFVYSFEFHLLYYFIPYQETDQVKAKSKLVAKIKHKYLFVFKSLSNKVY